MKLHHTRSALMFALAASLAGLAACGQAPTPTVGPAAAGSAKEGAQSAYAADPTWQNRPFGSVSPINALAGKLGDNETYGFGANALLKFVYQQQFDCVVQPGDDRNYNGTPAALDPKEFYTPECQVGAPSKIDPTGGSVRKTDPLYVMLPFFETNPSTPAFSKKLGAELKSLFGFVPDAFKPDPGVAVQCPAPKDMPASCTMHPLQTDLGPVLAQLGLVPPNTLLYVPLANHDHLLRTGQVMLPPEWWQVIVVLVEDPNAWPDAAGTQGITSVPKLRAAQQAKQASADVPTNFFLYFSSKQVGIRRHQTSMPGMKM